MNKSIFKTVMCIMVFIMLVACKNELPVLDDKPQITITNNEPSEFTILNILSETQYDIEKVEEWNNYLKQQFNCSITYNYKPLINQEDIASFDGLVFLSLDQFLPIYPSREGTIQPLDSVVQNIEAWDLLPLTFQKALYMPDGKIWGLISEDWFTDLPMRHYNKTMLNQLGKQLPQNTIEFYELLIDVKDSYPDVAPLVINKDNILYGLSDILNAFGIPVYRQNYNYFSSIQYSVEKDCFIDIAYEDNFKAALYFIKNLSDENLLKIEETNERVILDRFCSGYIFSMFKSLAIASEDLQTSYDIDYSYFLMNPQFEPASVIPYKSLNVLVLGGLTSNPEGIIKKLLESFYTNEKGLIVASYGIPHLSSYEIKDDRIILDYNYNQDNNFLPIRLPNLTNKYISNTTAEADNAYQTKIETERDCTEYLEINNLYAPYDMGYILSQHYSDDLYAISIHQNNLLYEFLNGEINIDEYYFQYTNMMRGISYKIDQINEYYGLLQGVSKD